MSSSHVITQTGRRPVCVWESVTLFGACGWKENELCGQKTTSRMADRYADLWPVLACIRYKTITDHLDLFAIFEEAGSHPNGTMSARKFKSALVVNFKSFEIVADVLAAIEEAYGCGYQDVRGKYENIAWRDFCDDVERSLDNDPSGGLAEALAATRGAQVSFQNLASTRMQTSAIDMRNAPTVYGNGRVLDTLPYYDDGSEATDARTS